MARCSTTYTRTNQSTCSCYGDEASVQFEANYQQNIPIFWGFNQMCMAFWINCKLFFCICASSHSFIFSEHFINRIKSDTLVLGSEHPAHTTVTITTTKTHHVNTQITITLQLIKVSARPKQIIGMMFIIMHIKKVCFYHYFMGVRLGGMMMM